MTFRLLRLIHRQRRAVRVLRRLHGAACYSWWFPEWLSRSLSKVGIGAVTNVSFGYTRVVDDSQLRVLSDLPFTETLSLRDTRITDEGLRWLPKLARLVHLHLGETAITDEGIRRVAACATLEVLSLDATFITDRGMRAISQLPNLHVLRVDDTQVSDQGLRSLAGMHSLWHVSATCTKVTDTGGEYLRQALPQCKVVWQRSKPQVKLDESKLHGMGREMVVGRHRIVPRQWNVVRDVRRAGGGVMYSEWSPQWLSRALAWAGIGTVCDVDYQFTEFVDNELFGVLRRFPFLRILLLRGTNVDEEGLQHLAALKQLNFLDLGNAKGITDRAAELAARCHGLTTLFLDGTLVTDNGLRFLATLPNVTQLYLDRTAVSDSGLECLRHVKSLTALWLRDTPVTEAGVERLKEALPQCSIVWRHERAEGS